MIQYLQQCQTQKGIDPSQLNKNILILYGTQGGTSLEAAKQIQSQLKENNVPSEIRSMEHVQAKDLLKESRVILVCCTYGQGEFPPSAKSFWASLNDSSIVKNNQYLSHLEFAVFGLGSTQYKYRSFTVNGPSVGNSMKQVDYWMNNSPPWAANDSSSVAWST